MESNNLSDNQAGQGWRVRFGLVESFLLIFILFAGIELSLGYRESISAAREQAAGIFVQSSRNLQTELGDIHEAVDLVLHSARAYREAGIFDPAGVKSANALFINYMRQYPFITSINTGDAAGNGYLLLLAGKQLKNRIKKADEKRVVTWLTLGEKGEVLSKERKKDDYDPRKRLWYQSSVSRADIVWSDPYIFRTTGEVGITAAMRLESGRGGSEVVGVDITLKDISYRLAALTSGTKGMTAHLLARDGTVVACSEVEQFLSLLKEKDATLAGVDKGSYPLVKKALQSRTEEKVWSFSFDNRKSLAIVEPVSFSPNGKYSLVLTVPEDVLIGHFAKDALWRLIIVLLLLSAVSVWYFNRFLIPLRRIAAAIREFGAGSFRALSVDTERRDEIGILSSEFVKMISGITERDAVLRENEARYRTLADLGSVLIWSSGIDKMADYFNRTWLDFTGRTPEQEFGQGWTESVHPQDLERCLDVYGGAFDRREKYSMIYRLRRHDGEYRWIQGDGCPRYAASGEFIGYFGYCVDITEPKQMKDSLLRQKKFTEQLIQSSAAAIFVLDPEHRVIIWNKACEELTGIASSVMVGTTDQWQAFYDHERHCLADIVLDIGFDGLSGMYDTYTKSTLVPNGLHAEGWYKNLHGNDRYLLFDAAPVYDGTGELLAAIQTLNDITEQKRADTDMRLQSAALKAAANAIVITDAKGTIEWVNPAFTALTGYTPEEAVGKNPRELVKSGVHEQLFYKQMWETLSSGEVWRGQVMNRRKDGSLYPEGQTITPVKDADGVISHFIAIKRDLSEHIKLEEQLRQSQKMESVGTLAGGIAHDFNNILAAIIGYGQFTLMKMPADDQLRGYIKNILEAADRAAHLTRELLLFSRKQAIEKKPVDLNLLVAKVEKFLTTIIGEDIEYKTVIHDEPLPVIADSYQFEQILMNLVTNARDAMPKGGSLTVVTTVATLEREILSVRGCRKPGTYALVTVTDTGEGMDAETLRRIFEPFFTTKEVGKGTGLGLAVVYGIIEQHDGCITVQSEPGKGASFKIFLPLLPPEAIEEPKSLAEKSLVGGSETILMAEDDSAVRVLTKKLLEEFGYTVIEAVDGADAVNRFRENSEAIDLILSDLIMPKMSGKDAIDEIRKTHPGVKVIFSSGYAPDTIRDKVSLEGSAHLIAKPVSPSELLKKVRSVLDEGR